MSMRRYPAASGRRTRAEHVNQAVGRCYRALEVGFDLLRERRTVAFEDPRSQI